MEKLYYISQGKNEQEQLKNIEKVCTLGVKLIQLRVKNVSYESYLAIARQAKKLCDTFSATLIINDNIEIAKEINAGVHLGKNDDSIQKAKQHIKNNLTGGTANTLADCIHLINQKVDYIGLGPFKYTTTKQNLSPILGLNGYENILKTLNNKGHYTPVFAIGGIANKDIENLLQTGIHGIAVSGFLTNWEAEELPQELKRLL